MLSRTAWLRILRAARNRGVERVTNDVEAKIREYIGANLMMGQDVSTLAVDDSFLDNGIIDSTGVLELISFLEDGFGIQVLDQEMTPANLDSIGNLMRFIASKKA